MDPEFTTDYSIRYHVRNDEVQKIIIGMRIQLAFQSVCSHILIYASLTSSRYNPSEFIFNLEILFNLHRPFGFVWAVPSFLLSYMWMYTPQEFPMLQTKKKQNETCCLYGYKMERKKEIRSVGE
ncbi:unnamed protein product [Urochloa humidicola]